MHAAESNATRLIYSATPKERIKFLNKLNDHYESQNLYDRSIKLWSTPQQEWTKEHEEEFNKCDEQHIVGMLAAEKNTCKVKQYAWSPKYSQAVEERNFWKILLMLKRNHERPNTKTKAWAETFGIQDIGVLTESQINSNLRKAQGKLKEVKREAAKWREEHLRELLYQQQET